MSGYDPFSDLLILTTCATNSCNRCPCYGLCKGDIGVIADRLYAFLKGVAS